MNSLIAPVLGDERAEVTGTSARDERRLRVCHLAYTFYEADNRVIRYARDMAQHGHRVDVIALRRPGQAVVGHHDEVRVIRIQRRSVSETMAVAYLLKLVLFLVKAGTVLSALQLRHRYDVVHVHNVPDFLVFAALLPKLTGSRIILDIHDIVPELYAGKFGAPAESRACRALLRVERASCGFADHVIVANDLWHATLSRRSARQCTTILNYPDVTLFAPLGERRRRGNPFVFLYPGSLNHHQGVDIAIRAFARVKDVLPDAELHVYGDGPSRPMLAELVRSLGLGSRVHLRDRVALAEMARIIASADAGVVPKRADGFGNEAFSTKILEFMASGVPVIVSRTRVDAHHFDSTLVRFFTPGSERELAEAMRETYESRDAALARAEAARSFALRNSWQQRGGEYRALVRGLVEPRPAGEPALT